METGTEFNMGISDLQRLNIWFLECEFQQSQNGLNEWWSAINNAYDIVSTYITDQENSNFEKLIIIIENKIGTIMGKSRRQGFVSIPQDLHTEIRQFYRSIRKHAKKHGLLMKFKEDAGVALR